ncbi:PREDICTED: mimitin, mitochondrial [Nicrophorus vespilloides]|uniref:Mimitin, mitochondrial n=1 Tax=Nicrophorus vespilloides TaxID=110193 RepID=A0ABM1NAX4_NICVS|nr:PREDICTED: mimitin, mitochondrial [Nicrophorus vespilloides]
MSQPPARSIWAMIIRNFINSLKPRQFSGTHMGSDHFGNKYYEIPANPSIGKRRANRWFEPKDKEDFQQEMPAEWEAWLRGRRVEVPSDEEVLRNLAIMQLKKKNAIAIEAKAGKKTPMEKGMESFPKRNEYEMIPGKRQNET